MEELDETERGQGGFGSTSNQGSVPAQASAGIPCAFTNADVELNQEERRRLIRDKVRSREIARERGSSPSERAAPAKRLPDQAIQLWLIDTGCGHDLVSRKEISAIKQMVRTAGKTIVLHTAYGKSGC